MQALDENTSLLTKKAASHVSTIMNYVPSWNTLAYGSLAMSTTLPFMPYIFSPTPELLDAEWWTNLPMDERASLSITALLLLVSGTLTKFQYLQETVNNLQNMFGNFCSSVGNFFSNTLTLLLSVIAGIPTGALGYFGALWAGKIVASLSGLLSYLLTVSLRIALLPQFVHEIRKSFDSDWLFQKQIIRYLKLIKQDKREICEKVLRDNMQHLGKKTIDEDVINNLLNIIFTKNQTETLFNTVTIPQKIGQVCKIGLATISTVWIASAFSLFIAQASYEGFRLLCYSFTQEFSIDFWPYIAKLGLVSLPGLLSGVILLLPVFTFIHESIEDIVHHIKQKPLDLIKLILIAISCALTATSMQNAAKGLADNPDNLFNLSQKNNTFWQKLYYQLYSFGVYGASFMLDMKAWIALCQLDKNMDMVPTVNKSIEWLRKNTLPTDTLSALKQYTFFCQPKKADSMPKEITLDLNHVVIT